MIAFVSNPIYTFPAPSATQGVCQFLPSMSTSPMLVHCTSAHVHCYQQNGGVVASQQKDASTVHTCLCVAGHNEYRVHGLSCTLPIW